MDNAVSQVGLKLCYSDETFKKKFHSYYKNRALKCHMLRPNSGTALKNNLFFVLSHEGYLVGISYPHSCRVAHLTSSIRQ